MSASPPDGPPSPGDDSPDDAASARGGDSPREPTSPTGQLPAPETASRSDRLHAPGTAAAPGAAAAPDGLSPRLAPAAAVAAATGFVVYAVLDFSGSGSTTAARLLVLASVLCVLAGRMLWFGDERSPNV